MDCCTSVADAGCLAALVQSTLRMLYRLRRSNQQWRTYADMLVLENRWRAMRYGTDEGLLDLARGQLRPFPELLDEWIELVSEDAEALGCTAQVTSARDILARGTSSHRQVAVYHHARQHGASEREALQAVVDWLITETARDLDA
jgi:glutamate---cysteine ligase / carboxylate-amine ligase